MSAPLRILWRSAALDPESGLSTLARLAVCVYAEYARNDSGVLDPAPAALTIAERMAAGERTVRKLTGELAATGWLVVTHRPGRPSRMQLAIPDPCIPCRATPAPTPARTPAPTPARAATEPGEPGGAVAPRRPVEVAVSSNGQALVAHYVDLVRNLGEPAPQRLVGQVAKQVGELLRDEVTPPTIARCLELLVEKRLHPSTLASLVPEAKAGPRKDHEHIADRLHREALELRRQEEADA